MFAGVENTYLYKRGKIGRKNLIMTQMSGGEKDEMIKRKRYMKERIVRGRNKEREKKRITHGHRYQKRKKLSTKNIA